MPVTAGLMPNVTPRMAVGGIAGLDPDTEYSDWIPVIGPRVRYWLRDTSIDAQATLTLGDGRVRNSTFQVIWMYRDLFGFDAGILFDRVEDAHDRSTMRPFLGARLGSHAGVAGWAPTAAFYLLGSAIMSGRD